MIHEFYLPKWIKARLNAEDRLYFDKALQLFKEVNPTFSPNTGESFIQLASHLKAIINTLKVHGPAGGHVHSFSADNRLRSEQARARLLPAVEAIRAELFGKPAAPFSTVKSASVWLEREIRGDEQRFREAGIRADRVRQIDKRIGQLTQERRNLWPSSLTVAVDEQTLDVWRSFKGKRGGAFSTFKTYPGTRPRRLRDEIKVLQAESLFTERALLYWILADVKPWAVTATVEIHAPFTTRDLLKMYKSLPRMDGIRPKKISAGSADIMRFIDRLGGPPAIGKMEFWRMATARWNRTHRDREFASDALRKAYERTARRL